MSDLAHDPDDLDLTDDDRIPIEVLASDFIDRRRQGEEVTIEAFAESYPEMASEIRELFPAMLAMESFKENHSSTDGFSPPASTIEIPERLGDLRIVRQIGRGGMGIVYEAEQESLGRRVAVKVLPHVGVGDEKRERRFHREASAAAKLHHTNIVPVLGVGECGGLHYYVMQLIRGVGIDELIARHRERAVIAASDAPPFSNNTRPQVSSDSETRDNHVQDRFSLTDRVLRALETESEEAGHRETPQRVVGESFRAVAKIGLQVAEALDYAHDMNTLHRDIKPANLIVDEHGIVWVTDFGLAKMMDGDELSQTGDMVGTLRYMAPERFQGNCDHRSDIHALGLTLYELCAGRPAYDSDDRGALIRMISQQTPKSLRRIRRQTPRDLDTIIHKAVAIEPNERYQSAMEMAEDLRRFLDDIPIRARRTSGLERSWRWCRRNPATASLVTTCLLLFATVWVLAINGYFQSQRLLASEQQQRRVAEATNELAVGTLDKIYEQFAPQRGMAFSYQSLVGEDGETIEVGEQPVLSDEAARILENLLPVYRDLADLAGGDNSKYQLKALRAQRRIGDIRSQLGQPEQALREYRAAEAQLQALLRDSEPDPTLTLEFASLKNEIGVMERSQQRGQTGGRMSTQRWQQAHHEAFGLLDQLTTEDFSEHPRLEELATYERTKALYYLGRVGQVFFLPEVELMREMFSRRGRGGDPRGQGGFGGGFPRGGREGGGTNEPPRGRPRPMDEPPSADDPSADATDDDATDRTRPGPGFVSTWEAASDAVTWKHVSVSDLNANTATMGDREWRRITDPIGELDGVVDASLLQDGRHDNRMPQEGERRGRGNGPGRGGDRDNDGRRPSERSESERGRADRNRWTRPVGDREILDQAIEGAEYLVSLNSENDDYQYLLASCYRERAMAEESSQLAGEHQAKAISILQSLVDEHPNVTDYRYELAQTHATDLREFGSSEFDELEIGVREALVHTRYLTQRHPNIQSFAELHGRLLLKEAEFAILREQYGEAEEILWQSVETYLLLTERAPESMVARFGLATAVRFWIVRSIGRIDAALETVAATADEGLDQEPELRRAQSESLAMLNREAERLEQIVSIIDQVEPVEDRFRVEALRGLYPQLAKIYDGLGEAEKAAVTRESQSSVEALIEERRDNPRPPYGGRRGGPRF